VRSFCVESSLGPSCDLRLYRRERHSIIKYEIAPRDVVSGGHRTALLWRLVMIFAKSISLPRRLASFSPFQATANRKQSGGQASVKAASVEIDSNDPLHRVLRFLRGENHRKHP